MKEIVDLGIVGHVTWEHADKEYHNIVTSGITESIAQLLAGTASGRPTHIGYLVGPTDATVFNPDVGTDMVDVINWCNSESGSQLLVFKLCGIPMVASNEDGSCDITFNAVSETPLKEHNIYYNTTGSVDFTDPNHICGVVLLSAETGGSYKVLAASNMGNARPAKDPSREFAIYWRLTISKEGV